MDAINFTLCIDHKLHNELRNISFDSSVLNLAAPFEISKDLAYPKPAVSTMANWISYPNDKVDVNKLQLMMNNLTIISS